ncbi:MAG: carbamoylphosphate synthase large subunit [Polyangiales bacterium]
MRPTSRRGARGQGSKTILLTGGRAAATIELARLFQRGGHRVVVAESFVAPLSDWSRSVDARYRVPRPLQEPAAFVASLIDIVRREAVDLIVPTCEEVFHVAAARDELSLHCDVYCESRARLRRVHSKFEFAQRAKEAGVAVPPTKRITERNALEELVARRGLNLVLKPEFSRFGTNTLIRPASAAQTRDLKVDDAHAWVAQDFARGTPLCTWAVAHQGELRAYSAYRVTQTAGGAAITFEHTPHAGAREWTERFVRHVGFTGQIAFDFIEEPSKDGGDGEVIGIECNPRATSGVHLFRDDARMADAFLHAKGEVLAPGKGRFMLALPMFTHGLGGVRSWEGLRSWATSFAASRSVLFDGDDPGPFLLQGLSFAELAGRALAGGVDLLSASTLDIEWNGEE